MLLILFQKVTQDARDKLKGLNLQESEKEEKLGKQLAEEMATHVVQLGEMIEKDKRDLQEEIAEQKKKITTEDMHDGFETHVRGPTSSPPCPMIHEFASIHRPSLSPLQFPTPRLLRTRRGNRRLPSSRSSTPRVLRPLPLCKSLKRRTLSCPR